MIGKMMCMVLVAVLLLITEDAYAKPSCAAPPNWNPSQPLPPCNDVPNANYAPYCAPGQIRDRYGRCQYTKVTALRPPLPVGLRGPPDEGVIHWILPRLGILTRVVCGITMVLSLMIVSVVFMYVGWPVGDRFCAIVSPLFSCLSSFSGQVFSGARYFSRVLSSNCGRGLAFLSVVIGDCQLIGLKILSRS